MDRHISTSQYGAICCSAECSATASQSAQHFEAAVDEWMKLEPWKGMKRNEARRIIAGLMILGARRVPEDVDVWQSDF